MCLSGLNKGAAAILAMALYTVQAAAAPPESQATMIKRQVNGCMVKRMGADRALSFNDAMRTCKEQLQPPKAAMASILPGDPAAKGR